MGSLGGSVVKNLLAVQQLQELWVWSLGWEDPLEEGMATHSSILAWRIPWTEEPGGLQSMGSQRVRRGWSDAAHTAKHGGRISKTWVSPCPGRWLPCDNLASCSLSSWRTALICKLGHVIYSPSSTNFCCVLWVLCPNIFLNFWLTCIKHIGKWTHLKCRVELH